MNTEQSTNNNLNQPFSGCINSKKMQNMVKHVPLMKEDQHPLENESVISETVYDSYVAQILANKGDFH